jgi:predicted DNA-binding ribbon-helix-helix protein
MTTSKKRTVVYLDSREWKALKDISAKTGAPVGELIRRAIEKWLKKASNK